jgi:ankyrin repeat protein
VKRAFGVRFCLLPLAIASCLVASCESPRKKAQRQLSERGIEPSGRALLEAVEKGASEETELLLHAGVHTGYRDDTGRLPLHVAILKRDLRTAELLFKAGADVNAVDDRGVPALGYALDVGENGFACQLIDAGANADGRMPNGEVILPWAIREGRGEFVTYALHAGADPHLLDKDGNPLVQVAVQSDRHEVMGLLLERGADAAAVDGLGRNLLHHALERGWADLVPQLLKAGADPNATDVDGRTPIEQAIAKKDATLLGLLLAGGGEVNRRNAEGDMPIHLALRANWPEGRRLLAKAGADFNAKDGKQRSPIAYALESGNGPLVQELAEHGVDPPPEGWSPWLNRALDRGNVAMVRNLRALGASLNRRGPTGLLPVEQASLRGDGSMVLMLLNGGAPVGDALYLACAKGDLDMAGLLLASGVSPNPSRTPWLDTPLGAGIRSGNDRLVEELLRRGADPFLKTAEGQKPLNLAIVLRRPRAVALLLERGANPNEPLFTPARPGFIGYVKSGLMRYSLKNERNVTPLMVAACSGELETTASLLKAGAKKDVTTRGSRFWPINFASKAGDVRMIRLMLGRDPLVEERVIVISLSQQRARVYNPLGEEIFNTRVSTGKAGFQTPTGEFAITDKNRDWTSTIYRARMPYFQRLSGSDFGLHEGVVPGYAASHGCIRIPSGNARKLFSMTKTGDRVKIVP